MLIKTGRDGFNHPIPSDITPRAIYQDRRALLKLMASGAAGAALAGWAAREALAQQVQRPGKLAALPAVKSGATCPGSGHARAGHGFTPSCSLHPPGSIPR